MGICGNCTGCANGKDGSAGTTLEEDTFLATFPIPYFRLINLSLNLSRRVFLRGTSEQG